VAFVFSNNIEFFWKPRLIFINVSWYLEHLRSYSMLVECSVWVFQSNCFLTLKILLYYFEFDKPQDVFVCSTVLLLICVIPQKQLLCIMKSITSTTTTTTTTNNNNNNTINNSSTPITPTAKLPKGSWCM